MGEIQLSNCLSAEVGCSRTLRWLVLRGEIDLAGAPALRAILLDDGAPTVIVDLAGVSFVDVVGVETLASVHRVLESRGGAVVLRRARSEPRRLFALLGLAALLEARAA